MNRRAFLGSAAGVAGVGLAGCLGSGGSSIQIAGITVVNSNGQTHTVGVEVLFDGDRVLNKSYELASGERTDRIESGLPDKEGKFEITVAPSGIGSTTFVPGEQTEASCGSLMIELLRDQALQSFESNC